MKVLVHEGDEPGRNRIAIRLPRCGSVALSRLGVYRRFGTVQSVIAVGHSEAIQIAEHQSVETISGHSVTDRIVSELNARSAAH